MTDFDPGPLARVAARRDDDRITLEFEREFEHPAGRVWTMLTDPDSVGRWAPFRPDRDLGAEGPVTLQMIDGMSDEAFDSVVRVAIAPEALEYTWAGGVVRWELAPANGGTRLTLLHGVDDPDLLPKLAAGWHLCLAVADRRLHGRDAPAIRGDRAQDYGWDELHGAYQALLAAGSG
jgi:uncharacterized protein YndB with AHSA1/START domain